MRRQPLRTPGLDERDRAFAWLDRAYQEHSNILLGRFGLAQEYFGDVRYERASSGVVPLSQHVRVVTAA